VKIPPLTSFFLDLLRIASAAGVVGAHLANTRLAPTARFLQPVGHLMVVCFFVLSGFLIAASVEGKEMSWGRYATLRLGRLWSVLIPCLALTLVLQLLVTALAPEQAALFQRGHLSIRYGLSALFLNELWFNSSGPSFNSPLWSLAYEAWYYAFFGVCIFVRSRIRRMIVLVAMAVVVGPKVLALFPVWLTGVALWKAMRWRAQLRPWAWPLFGGALGVAAAWVEFNPHWPLPIGYRPWFFSAAFLSDLVFGFAVAGVILGVDLLWGTRTPIAQFDRPVRSAAGVSFTLYLLHFPLLVMAAALLPYDRSNPWHVGMIAGGIFAISFFVGSWIEPQRRAWTALLARILARMTRRWGTPVPALQPSA
jgi:peptidoglycan/LPS O-acetylase OafA/YrhL